MRGAPEPRGGRRVDLHTHTRFSDGLLEPEALVDLAVERGLAALAVTDHDSIAGLARASLAGAGRIEVVPGIEISTFEEGVDLHVLGFYIDPEHPALRQRLEGFRRERIERADAMIARLHLLGATLDRDAVFARSSAAGVVGRPHIAEALISAGHANDVDDAFRRFLGVQGLAYVPRPAFRPSEAIALIHDAGGVSVLAHAGPIMPDHVIEALVARGLRGIEVWHPQHGTTAVRRYQALAHRLNLLMTGGSDFHSPTRGTPLGDLPVPYAVLGPLKQAAGVSG